MLRYLDCLLLVTDTAYIPTGEGPAASPIQVISDTTASGIVSHTIDYNYDPLYRLTDATYTGNIEATYLYSYDPVGNMNAYTETIDAQTTRVIRYFDDANRLQNALDLDAGTTSYLYDNNGNLTLTIPPDGAEWLHYGFDQRNLMISHTVSISTTSPQTMATFVYDGNGNRVQQTDSSGSQPTTTTYINDVVGLTQVLVADDGTSQVYNLFGLDLIAQDDATNTRTMLADGLGSVRTELVGGTVESTSTYDPYGNLLQQTGNSGTTYGYTGEQQDSSTGLLYLRARFYNPALRTFMGRDPWSGNIQNPQSMNGWSYVEGNPSNLIDTTGTRAFPYHCGQASATIRQYVKCVTDEFNVEPPFENGQWEEFFIEASEVFVEAGMAEAAYPIDWPTDDIQGSPNCYNGPVPYRGKGYYETRGATDAINVSGVQIVYDFASLTRNRFTYSGMFAADDMLGGRFSVSNSAAAGSIKGFRSWQNVNSDYSGSALFYYTGVGPGAWYAASTGFEGSQSLGTLDNPDPTIQSTGRFYNYGILTGISLADIGIGIATYVPVGSRDTSPFYEDYRNDDYTVNKASLMVDLIQGNGSPLPWWEPNRIRYNRFGFSIFTANKYANVYEDMHTPWGR